MTATASRSSAGIYNRPSQTTAIVHEHRCLYTYDVRRKQKRWQDGRVKLHTFNKRLMVYDDSLNFIGDTHFKEDGVLQADDEVMLEDGVLVQFGELLATTQTDLAPLFEREKKKMDQRGPETGLSTNARTILGGKLVSQKMTPNMHQKHRSLNALLGSSRGAYGRASMPEQSPHEIRKANQEAVACPLVPDDQRDNKKRRIDQRALPRGQSDARVGSTLGKTGNMKRSEQEKTQYYVDITSDHERMPLSDITIPSSPQENPGISKLNTPVRTRPQPKARARQLQERQLRTPITKTTRACSPPVSTTNKVRSIDVLSPAAPIPMAAADATSNAPVVTKKTKVQLKASKTQHRPKLLCQKAAGRLPAVNKAPEKKRRSNLYKDLSDFEDDADVEDRLSDDSRNTGQVPGEPVLAVPEERAIHAVAVKHKPTVDPASMVREKETGAEPRKRQSVPHSQSEIDPASTLQPHIVENVESFTDLRLSNSGRPKVNKKAGTAKLQRSQGSISVQRPYVDRSKTKGEKGARLKLDEKQEQGPWTVEATDLFDWRPPDWEARQQGT